MAATLLRDGATLSLHRCIISIQLIYVRYTRSSRYASAGRYEPHTYNVKQYGGGGSKGTGSIHGYRQIDGYNLGTITN